MGRVRDRERVRITFSDRDVVPGSTKYIPGTPGRHAHSAFYLYNVIYYALTL